MIPIEKWTKNLHRCWVHDVTLLPLTSLGGTSILVCPHCNTQALDASKKQQVSVTLHFGSSKKPRLFNRWAKRIMK